MAPQIILGCVISYLLGSIPFSYIVAKKVKGVDIRVVGEGNVGGRNVWHVVGKKYGALAGGLDFTKGLLAYLVGFLLGLSPWWIWLCGVGVVAGHCYPVFLKGRGGKGLGAALGFLTGMELLIVIIIAAIYGFSYLAFRRFHLSASLAMGSVPILWLVLFKKSWTEFFIITGFLLLLGLKRLIDEPYMRKIKEASGGW
ncbi:MAG: acyl-phosphate glycerol 3-phosphate acyltransferase [Candidatus Aminicenantes bacterium]|nr:acyl-phosphate glycerol 3-phosphate acyltransferase [Candidatus Aminicenantes bacterium]